MKRLAIILAITVAGCSAGGSGGTDYLDEYGGQAAVYDRIAGLTDCDELQDEFDRAAENNELAVAGSDEADWTLGYMSAAEDRLTELDC